MNDSLTLPRPLATPTIAAAGGARPRLNSIDLLRGLVLIAYRLKPG